ERLWRARCDVNRRPRLSDAACLKASVDQLVVLAIIVYAIIGIRFEQALYYFKLFFELCHGLAKFDPKVYNVLGFTCANAENPPPMSQPVERNCRQCNRRRVPSNRIGDTSAQLDIFSDSTNRSEHKPCVVDNSFFPLRNVSMVHRPNRIIIQPVCQLAASHYLVFV